MSNALLWLLDVGVIIACLSWTGLAAGQRQAAQWATSRVTLALLVLSAAMAVFVTLIGDPPLLFADFRIAYYPAGAAVLDHPAALAPFIERGVIGFVNLPILAYLFAPFGALPLPVAAALFTAVGLAATVWACILMIRLAGLTGPRRLMLIFLVAANGPLNYSLKEGNTSQFVLLGLVGALCLLHRKRRLAAGALLAVVALIKLPLLLFGPYLLLRRNWPATAGFCLVGGVAVLLSLALFGWDMHVTWFDNAIRRFSDHTLSSYNAQSVQNFLLRLREPPSQMFNWTPSALSDGQRHLGSLLNGLLYLIAALACIKGSMSRRDDRASPDMARQDLEYMLVICLAVVTSPLSWSHYYAWLLLPIALFLGSRSIPTSSPIMTGLCWIGTILVMPVVVAIQFADPVVMDFYTKFAVSHYLLGGLIWFAVLAWCLARRPAPRLMEDGQVDRRALGARAEQF